MMKTIMSAPVRTGGFTVPKMHRAADYSPDLHRATDAKEAADHAVLNALTEDEIIAAVAVKAGADRTYGDLLLALDKKRRPDAYQQ